MGKHLILSLLALSLTNTSFAGNPIDDFGSIEGEQALRWQQIEDDVSRTAETLKEEIKIWKQQVQNRQLASVQDQEQKNFETWLELESVETDDPTFWLNKTKELGH